MIKRGLKRKVKPLHDWPGVMPATKREGFAKPNLQKTQTTKNFTKVKKLDY